MKVFRPCYIDVFVRRRSSSGASEIVVDLSKDTVNKLENLLVEGDLLEVSILVKFM